MVFLFIKVYNVNKNKWRSLEFVFIYGVEVRWLCIFRFFLKSILEKLKGYNYFFIVDKNMIIILLF